MTYYEKNLAQFFMLATLSPMKNHAVRRVLRPLDQARIVEDPAATPGGQQFYGEAIRELRNARGWTLNDLAESTGLSVGFLSRIERDTAQPSIKALHEISRSLDISIGWFFRSEVELNSPESKYVVRANRRRKLGFQSGITDELLSPNLSGQLELLLSRFPPGSESGSEAYAHIGEEAGVVVEGTLEIWVGDNVFVLEAGDSFSFPSTEPHRYRNPGAAHAVVIWAVTPPSY